MRLKKKSQSQNIKENEIEKIQNRRKKSPRRNPKKKPKKKLKKESKEEIRKEIKRQPPNETQEKIQRSPRKTRPKQKKIEKEKNWLVAVKCKENRHEILKSLKLTVY